MTDFLSNEVGKYEYSNKNAPGQVQPANLNSPFFYGIAQKEREEKYDMQRSVIPVAADRRIQSSPSGREERTL